MKQHNELNISHATEQLRKKVDTYFREIRETLSTSPTQLKEQILLLQQVRSAAYEAMNQLQHEHLILKTAEHLQNVYPKINRWTWHPHQTGDLSEADLTGYQGAKIIVSAEITTSMNPVGTIDGRMKSTLLKLDKLNGDKFYVVQTKSMEKRANTKVRTNSLNIRIVCFAD